MKPLLLIGSFALSWVACSPSGQKDSLLEEAAQYHKEATQIQAVVEPQIEQLDSLRTILAKSTKPTAAATVVALDSLKKAFEEWEENLVEVPGMPHEHHHDHGKHDHQHHADATLKDLPADQMRNLQKETRDNIRQLQERTDVLLKQTQTLLSSNPSDKREKK